MLTLTEIIGSVSDQALAHQLHHLEHDGAIEHLILSKQDTQRHRLRATTDRGTEVAIAIPRGESLANGAILLLEPNRAIVVRVTEQEWLSLRAADVAAAIELGYFAGNMHWKVRFEGDTLHIALEGPKQRYLDRLAHLLVSGKTAVTDG